MKSFNDTVYYDWEVRHWKTGAPSLTTRGAQTGAPAKRKRSTLSTEMLVDSGGAASLSLSLWDTNRTQSGEGTKGDGRTFLEERRKLLLDHSGRMRSAPVYLEPSLVQVPPPRLSSAFRPAIDGFLEPTSFLSRDEVGHVVYSLDETLDVVVSP